MSEVRRVFTTNNFNSFDEVRGFFKKHCLSVRFFPVSDERNNGNNLYRVHYTSESDLTNPLVFQCKGIILDMKTNQIVCYSSDYIYEHPTDTLPDSVYSRLQAFNDVKVEEAVDGTVIRLFHHNDEWRLATNKTLDAYWKGARWNTSRKTFGQMFSEAVSFGDRGGLDYTKLNKEYAYSFILMHPENRIIHRYHTPNIRHISTMNQTTLSEVFDTVYFLNGHEVPKPADCTSKFDTFDTVLNAANSLHYENEGYLLSYKNEEDDRLVRVKVVGKEYLNVKMLKGNTFNMNERCLDLLLEGKLKLFLNYFPEFNKRARHVQEQIFNLVGSLHKEYITTYIHKKPFPSTEARNEVLGALHNHYLETRKKVTTRVITDYLKTLPAEKMKALLLL